MAYTLRHAGWSCSQRYKTHYQVFKTYFCDQIVYLRAGNIGLTHKAGVRVTGCGLFNYWSDAQAAETSK